MRTKKIGEFLLESLLIIFSVLISFYIEGWRQDRLDHKKEIEYLQRIYSDLSVDSSRLEVNQAIFETFKKRTGEFLATYDRWDGSKNLPIPNDSIASIILMLHIQRDPFVPSSSAYSSLKSNGELGLIQNKLLADKIINYYERNIERPIMQNFLDLIQNQIIPYFGANMDIGDLFLVSQRKFGLTKSDYYKLYKGYELKSCVGYVWQKTFTATRYLSLRLNSIKELKELINQELNKE